jgi:hypothetical protein
MIAESLGSTGKTVAEVGVAEDVDCVSSNGATLNGSLVAKTLKSED